MSAQKTKLNMAVGAALVAGAVFSSMAGAADNPFSSEKLSTGYQLADAGSKTADGKCGGDKKTDAKCGADKKAKQNVVQERPRMLPAVRIRKKKRSVVLTRKRMPAAAPPNND